MTVNGLRCELVSWQRAARLARDLAVRIRGAGFHPEVIVAIGRGGYVPGRLLADHLGLMNLTSFRIEHYTMGTHKEPVAEVKHPLCVDVSELRVLVVDDVSDSGDTLHVAIRHIEEKSRPAAIKTAVLHHKVVSRFQPDFYAQKVVRWRWITYPWAQHEDLSGLVAHMEPPVTSLSEAIERLRTDCGIRVSEAALKAALFGNSKADQIIRWHETEVP